MAKKATKTAKKRTKKQSEELVEDEALEVEESDDDELEDEVDADTDDNDDDDDDDDDDEEEETALGELEAEELQMLTADEQSETLLVDEKAEAASIRRAELALDVDPEEVSSDEFVCQQCFLVLRLSQRAGPRKKICKDCAA